MPTGTYKRTPENTTRYWLGKKRENLSGEKHPMWRGGKMEKQCLLCQSGFLVSKSRNERKYKVKFCSTKCYFASKVGTTKNVQCNFCKEEFRILVCNLKNGGGKFCSRICYYEFQRGKVGYWKGKERLEMRKPKSEECKRKIGLANSVPRPERRGENSASWKGGISDENQLIRHTFEYQEWRKSVFERDNWTCLLCGVKGGKIEADHIAQFAYFPELRFDVNNGRTLCYSCHRQIHSKFRKTLA